MQDSEIHYMRTALKLAHRGLGRVEPNPMVGAVIVRDGRVIGQGYHRRCGQAHAEIEALADVRRRGGDAAGSEVFVTLEPCCHHGRTPPCTDALIAARVRRVVVAMVDPDPRVAGAGIAQLRAAGIDVQVGLCENEAQKLNEPFIKRAATGLPWVIAKWAQTLDGRVATATGDSKWISGDAARRFVHRLRSRVDAVMVGSGTVLADDPRLTARNVKRKRIARRVVVDPALRTPLDAKLFDDDVPVTIAVREALLEERPDRLVELAARGVEFIGLPVADDPARLSLRPLLAHLAQSREASNVLVEGGPRLTGALLREGLIDQVLAFVAPKLLGDAAAQGAVAGFSRAMIAEATALQLVGVKRFGDDVLLDYRLGER